MPVQRSLDLYMILTPEGPQLVQTLGFCFALHVSSPFAEEGFTCLDHSLLSKKKRRRSRVIFYLRSFRLSRLQLARNYRVDANLFCPFGRQELSMWSVYHRRMEVTSVFQAHCSFLLLFLVCGVSVDQLFMSSCEQFRFLVPRTIDFFESQFRFANLPVR